MKAMFFFLAQRTVDSVAR